MITCKLFQTSVLVICICLVQGCSPPTKLPANSVSKMPEYEISIDNLVNETSENALIDGQVDYFTTMGLVTANNLTGQGGVPNVTITFARKIGTGSVPSSVITDLDGRWSQEGFDRNSSFLAIPSRQETTNGQNESWTFTPCESEFSQGSDHINFSQDIRTFTWSGIEWVVKCGKGGPSIRVADQNEKVLNLWLDGPDSVWVDSSDRLHLKIISFPDGDTPRWFCAEVQSKEYFGPNTEFVFHLASRYDQLNPSIMAGMFTHYVDDREIEHEIDIEFSCGCLGENDVYVNSQYVIQRFDQGQQRYVYLDNLHTFTSELNSDYTSHSIIWHEDYVDFESYQRNNMTVLDLGEKFQNWSYRNLFHHPPSQGKLILNLWLCVNPSLNQDDVTEFIIQEIKVNQIS